MRKLIWCIMSGRVPARSMHIPSNRSTSPQDASERAAVLGRGQVAMEGGFRRILERISFAIVELHPDNVSEFFNQHAGSSSGRTKSKASSSLAREPITKMRTDSSSKGKLLEKFIGQMFGVPLMP